MLITEMARRLQISTRAIRFYEEKGLIAPAKGSSSGYRQFSEEDAWRLQTIVALREVGMSIGEIRTVLQKVGEETDSLLPFLELQRAYMYERWVELKNVIQTTERMIDKVKLTNSVEPGELYALAEANKIFRQTREGWVDRWDFNQLASVYDELIYAPKSGYNPHLRYDEALAHAVAFVHPLPGERGLDAGTGTGNLAFRFSQQGAVMSAVDQSSEMLKSCKRKNPGIEAKLGSLFAIPYLDHSFDFVASSYALHHSTDEQKKLALAEFVRVLKPQGRLAIVDLMFRDEQQRHELLSQMADKGEHDALAAIEQKYYGNCQELVAELEQLGFSTEVEQLHSCLFFIGARR